jgi:replicative DNA helicase
MLKVPPQALEPERAVLGTIMLEREKLSEVLAIVRKPECFYLDSHQKIYSAVQTLDFKGSPVDLLTVTEELRKVGDLERVGGAYYLTQLTMSVSSGAHVQAHARIVLEKWMSRELIRICSSATEKAYEDAEDVFDQLEKAEVALSAITDTIRTGNIKRAGEVFIEAIRDMKEARFRPDGITGLPTGIGKLDGLTRGLQPSNLIILAAGTGEGKTTFALNLCEHVARNSGPSGFISLEMHDRELIWKLISRHIREDVNSVMSGNFSEGKWNELDHSRHILDLPLHIYDKGGLNIVELKATARTMVKKHGIKLLAIDYIQLVRGIPGKRYGTREEEVNDVSKNLKALAMELNIPIIALSQLNRMEKGAKRMYVLSDLRESGAIEQDANAVWFIYRPSEHKLTDFEGEAVTEFDAWLLIAKARLGDKGKFRLRFDGAFNQFSDYEEELKSYNEYNPYSAAIAAAGRKIIDFSEPQKTTYNEPQDESEDLPF